MQAPMLWQAEGGDGELVKLTNARARVFVRKEAPRLLRALRSSGQMTGDHGATIVQSFTMLS